MDGPAADATDPHPLPTPYRGGPLPITADGVGPLRWDAPRTMEVLRALFPDARIERRQLVDGENRRTILIVERANTPILEAVERIDDPVVDNMLAAFVVRVAAGQPVGPGGERLMDRWSRLDLKSSDCAMGEGRDRFALICPSSKAPSVKLAFGVPGWASDRVPPDKVLADKAFLREFIWTYSQNFTPPAPAAGIGAIR